MNYVQLFANGGKSDYNIFKAIQKILNVDDNQMEQLLQIGVKKYGSVEGIGKALQESMQGLSKNASKEEVKAAIESVFNVEEPSQMFKCGGKLQQLVTKFGKGSKVDCGCGGIKLDNGGKTLSDRASRTITQKDTADWYQFKNGMIKSVHPTNGDAPTYQVFDGTTLIAPKYSVAPKLENEIGIFARPFQYFGAARRITPEKAAEYEEARQSVFNVPAKQPGGTIELTSLPGYDVSTKLTRRQARELAKVNGMSENNEQFSFAMANAMNAARAMGLRGQEARQRAMEMAAGITPAERNINASTTSTFGNITPIKEDNLRSQASVQESISQPVTPTQEQSLDNLSFAQAFAQSRKSGAKTFNWRGKSYGTALKKQNPISLPKSIQLDTEYEIPDIPIELENPQLVITDSFRPSQVPMITPNTPEFKAEQAAAAQRSAEAKEKMDEAIKRQNEVRSNRFVDMNDGQRWTRSNPNTYDITGEASLLPFFDKSVPAEKWFDLINEKGGFYRPVKEKSPSIVPAGGGSYSWMQYKQGGQIEKAQFGEKLYEWYNSRPEVVAKRQSELENEINPYFGSRLIEEVPIGDDGEKGVRQIFQMPDGQIDTTIINNQRWMSPYSNVNTKGRALRPSISAWKKVNAELDRRKDMRFYNDTYFK